MNGTTTIVTTAEAEPRPAEMVSNLEALDILKDAGIEVPPFKRKKWDEEGFHGIQSRWHTPYCVTSYHLAKEAGERACHQAAAIESGFDRRHVDAFHCCSSSPDMIYSGISNRLQRDVGTVALWAEARDVTPGCQGGVDALALMDSQLRYLAAMENEWHNVSRCLYGVVAAAEAIAVLANEPDSTNYLVWGCGAVAVVTKFDPFDKRKVGIRRSKNCSDGRIAHMFESVGIGTKREYYGLRPNSTMGDKGRYGREVQEYIMDVLAPKLADFVASCGVDAGAPDSWLCSHNPTYDGAMKFGKKAGFAPERTPTVAAERGNTSSASPLLNYHDAKKRGLLKSGANVFMVGYGAGADIVFLYYVEP